VPASEGDVGHAYLCDNDVTVTWGKDLAILLQGSSGVACCGAWCGRDEGEAGMGKLMSMNASEVAECGEAILGKIAEDGIVASSMSADC
jgi:hypothetical protein